MDHLWLQLNAITGDTWKSIHNFIVQNKLTASLIATNALLVTWYICWKNSRRRRLIDKIPGITDYPIVGDFFTLTRDNCGRLCKYFEYHTFYGGLLHIFSSGVSFYNADVMTSVITSLWDLKKFKIGFSWYMHLF